jgi:hypothetical protein
MTKTAIKMSTVTVSNNAVDQATFLALCAQDKTAYKSNYKRVPMASGSAMVAKYPKVNGIPHKMVNGVLIPLTKKA